MNLIAMLSLKPHPLPQTARLCGPGFDCAEPTGRAEHYGHAEDLIIEAVKSIGEATTTAIASYTGLSPSAIRLSMKALADSGRIRLEKRGKTWFAEVA